MDIESFLLKHSMTRQAFGDGVGMHESYVRQVITGKRKFPVKRCILAEKFTNNEVTRMDLRPNDWREIWPELGDTR